MEAMCVEHAVNETKLFYLTFNFSSILYLFRPPWTPFEPSSNWRENGMFILQ